MSGALKEILDSLNEKPIRKKIITARPFLAVLEEIFKQRISRAQQDAHEFLQIVAEKLAEEYYAMERSNKKEQQIEAIEGTEVKEEKQTNGRETNGQHYKPDLDFIGDSGMPLEGTLESEIECMACHFKTKPIQSKFVVLTLSVPQKVHSLKPRLSQAVN